MDLNLAGKSALITGGSRGIGLAIARGLAAEGVALHLAARGMEALTAAKEEISARFAVSVTAHAVDLATGEGQAGLAAAVPEMDILVNNAGAIPAGAIEDVDEEKWRAGWELKVFGSINLTRAYYSRMKERGAGVIVNIVGMAGKSSTPFYIAGAAGNASLIQFSISLGEESFRHGVRVLCINPSPTLTERLVTLRRARAETLFGDPDRWREAPDNARLGRAAKPEEVANLAVFFASDAASYASGVSIDME